MRNFKLLLVLIFELIVTTLFAANPRTYITIEWLAPFENQLNDESLFKTLQFTGSVPDENFNPQYSYTEKLPVGTQQISVQLINVVTEALNETSLVRNSQSVPSEFKITSAVSYKKKQPYSSVLILAIRKNSSGQLERLKSFDIQITPS